MMSASHMEISCKRACIKSWEWVEMCLDFLFLFRHERMIFEREAYTLARHKAGLRDGLSSVELRRLVAQKSPYVGLADRSLVGVKSESV
jgi:hypothetical protein